ncbi:MAG: hypothetical protein SFU56_00355 [Capsulimonadales bacterium]|nr:hypothetical protein [Capsulimonadales bacterium]
MATTRPLYRQRTKFYSQPVKRGIAFSLIELLAVVAIIALVTAITFAVFMQSRTKSRETVCLSNLRQIGLGILAYAQDYDGGLPPSGSPIDLKTTLWSSIYAEIKTMKPLPELLAPYIKQNDLWRCPSDVGFDRSGWVEEVYFPSYPSSFQAHGTSYFYNMFAYLEGKSLANMRVYDPAPPHAEHGASVVKLMADGSGRWHGGKSPKDHRFGCLFADGHVRFVSRDQMSEIEGRTFGSPPPSP